MIELTWWSSLATTLGEPDGIEVPALIGMFKRHAQKPHDGRGWSPGTFKFNRRANKNAEKLFAIGLDCEHESKECTDDPNRVGCPDALASAIRCAGVIHTTRNHRAKAPRSRALVWLSRPVNAAEYSLLWAHLADVVEAQGLRVDRQTKEPGRLWYLPSISAEGNPCRIVEVDGPPLDVDLVLAEIARKTDLVSRETPSVSEPSPGRVSGDTRLGERAFDYLAKIPAAISGSGGHNQTFAVARALAGFVEKGLSESDAWAMLNGYNTRCQPPWSSRELRHKWKQAREKAHTLPALEDRPAPRASSPVSGETRLEPPPSKSKDDHTFRGLMCNAETGKVYGTASNIAILLSQSPEWAGIIRYNDFTCRVEITGRPPIIEGLAPLSVGPITDTAYTVIGAWLHGNFGVSTGQQRISEGVASAALVHRFNPLTEWLEGLRWDGTARLSTLATKYLGAVPSGEEQEVYLLRVPTAWMVGAVARAMNPGCQNDNVLVLVGRQGGGKSTTARTLAGNFYREGLPNVASKDALVGLRGAWIVELSELASLAKAEVESIKSFITIKEDSYRPPYGREVVSFPRTAVFIATTNTFDSLRDPTGARRFWPITVGDIDAEALRRDRDQLWAEAVALYRQKQSWWPDAQLVAAAQVEQEAHYAEDAWEAEISNYIARRRPSSELTSNEILSSALRMDPEKWNHAATNRVGSVLRRLGYERKKVRLDAKKTQWVWRAGTNAEEGTRGNSIKEPVVLSVPSVPSSSVKTLYQPTGESGGNDRPKWKTEGTEGTAGTVDLFANGKRAANA